MRRSLLLLVFFLYAAGAQGQVQTPAAFLGYELGDRFTPHHRVIAYVEHVAAGSSVVQLEPYGETYEGRPLQVAYVSAPENLARLESIRESNLRAAGFLPGGGTPEKAIVWLSYNVHGNEAVSTEAALATLYALADPSDARTQAWLQDVVIVLDPNLNPDGRDRYVHWYTQVAGRRPDADLAAREHREEWPGGRFNHYYFDLNRDWAWGTQQETRARLVLYNRWLPHVHVDFHEQSIDAPYYFAPAAEPLHERITPWQRELQTTIGQENARVFDGAGRLYFTRQRFDLLYPGYGDTWPSFNGAVGMTYEQAGSGRAGLAVVTAEDDTLTLRDRITHHFDTGLATVETVARDHVAVRENFRRYFTEPDVGPYRAFALRGSPSRLQAIAEHLELQGIRSGWAGRAQTVRGLAYAGGRAAVEAPSRLTVEPGDLIVSLDQPKAVLASVLLEPATALADSVTYDLTAWALPYAYGVEAFALEALVEAGGVAPVTAPSAPAGARPYAYLARWESTADLQLLAVLLRAGVGVRIATDPFEVEGQNYARGTLIVTRAGNARLGDRFDAAVTRAAHATDRPLVPVATGMVTTGADFGSADVRFLRAPRVAALAGEPVSPTSLGPVWHLFDETLDYPLTLLRPRDLDGLDLGDYDVLVMPHGAYGDWLTEARAETLRDWVRAGGRLIAMEGAARALAGQEGFALTRREAPADTVREDRLRRYGDRERDALAGTIPGSIYRVQVDDTHPLAFGYSDYYYALKQDATPFEFLETGWNVGVLRAGAPVAGFAGQDTRERLTDTLAFGVEEMGRGAVVYFMDDPLFRGFWRNGHLLFGNAVFGLGAR